MRRAPAYLRTAFWGLQYLGMIISGALTFAMLHTWIECVIAPSWRASAQYEPLYPIFLSANIRIALAWYPKTVRQAKKQPTQVHPLANCALKTAWHSRPPMRLEHRFSTHAKFSQRFFPLQVRRDTTLYAIPHGEPSNNVCTQTVNVSATLAAISLHWQC